MTGRGESGGRVRWLALGLLLWLALGLRPALALELTQAQLLRLDGPPARAASAPGMGPGAADPIDPARWQPVTLPDTWPAYPGVRTQHAVYRLAFTLDQPPGERQWALRIDRLASIHRLFLNGQLLHEQGEDGQGRVRQRLLPFYLSLPPALLRPGANELRLELQFGTRAGLSTVQVGLDDELLPGYERDRWLDTRWPQHLNLAGAVLGIGMLLLWWRRPQERPTGLFGAMWLIGSLRNFDYFVAVSPLSSSLSDWLYFTAQASTVALLGLFALALSGKPWPRLHRLFVAALAGLPLAGALAQWQGGFTTLRMAVYPLLVLLALVAVAVLAGVLRGVWRSQRPLALAFLVGGVALLVAAGGHDYAYLHGWVSQTGFFWLPYAVPFALAGYAALLLGRLVRALAHAEELSLMLERRVAERTAELAEANEAKTRFLAAASHDLRQPVVAIGLLAGLARERVAEGKAPALAVMDRLMQGVQALEELLRGLLDLSRLETGSAARHRQAVALQPLFDAIALHEQPNAQARGLRLRFRPTRAVVDSDPVLLEQILRNLVSNALRYTARGGVLVGVRRRGGTAGRPERWCVQVWDSGRGIAPEHQARIFDEFVQLDPAPAGHPGGLQGAGLGLSIVRRAAQRLHHRLGLASRPGRGSCFWIELPALAPAAPAPLLPTSNVDAPAP